MSYYFTLRWLSEIVVMLKSLSSTSQSTPETQEPPAYRHMLLTPRPGTSTRTSQEDRKISVPFRGIINTVQLYSEVVFLPWV